MKCKSGFVMRDAIFGIAALSVLGALALPVLSQVRMDSSRQACIGNYRFISETTGSYVNDNAGKMWALSWKAGMMNPYVPGFYFSNDAEAQSYQAVGILRRLAGLSNAQSPVPANWIPGLVYSHLALLDYINVPIPASFMICPEDWTRQRWAEGDISGGYPASGENGTNNWRWPYSTSYNSGVYQWSPSRQYTQTAPNGIPAKAPMVYQDASSTNLWSFDGSIALPGAFGPKPATDVRFPASKVFMSDDYARHNGKTRYYAYQSAGQDLLFYDGSVRYYRTDSTNPGWNPTSRTNRGNMTKRFAFTKTADVFGGLDNDARSASFTAGWYRWTRGGLNGWDVPRLSSMVGKLPDPNIVENEVDTSAATGSW